MPEQQPDHLSTRAYLGLGGNLGDPASTMSAALKLLGENTSISVEEVSSLYRTKPWGKVDQPDFLNCVASVRTSLSPHELLETCLSVEHQLKRERRERWGPRLIDIDVLVYGEEKVQTDDLEIPHPRIAERAFVLVPLLEIAPEITVDGKRGAELLAAIGTDGVEKVVTAGPWYLS
ncbi:2-amino-4-hydroxy-6-hydroxymethyldihydropteridine diphosphokinase [Nitratireductor aestuarii]|uniref:2-amino-4-hydroxy-6-hydroxymethyldihydropteridine pyrophosphokinase n=1 Tax=Nitratireductor aestuarii TaxID=1735103 RepID=A0A916REM1_9HYPH|nr:2-amino-4-hydroxy-6-hydroxymethyldihydropteridine diphosphokinase [Nitratireductor aestuarii]GGA53349.1 2-amino-4-hydroxy-6-hydroxymethyldihydropteridine diphosphokinase [Nitratireductor aestuarii]